MGALPASLPGPFFGGPAPVGGRAAPGGGGPPTRRPLGRRIGPCPHPARAPPVVARGLLRPGVSGNFSIFGAVLEPQSRGVLIRDKLESRGCLWGLPAIFMGSEEGDLANDATFLRHSKDIERALPVQLFVISAGPSRGFLARTIVRLACSGDPRSRGQPGQVRNRASWVVELGDLG